MGPDDAARRGRIITEADQWATDILMRRVGRPWGFMGFNLLEDPLAESVMKADFTLFMALNAALCRLDEDFGDFDAMPRHVRYGLAINVFEAELWLHHQKFDARLWLHNRKAAKTAAELAKAAAKAKGGPD